MVASSGKTFHQGWAAGGSRHQREVREWMLEATGEVCQSN
jgi:hypothetical protein